jgi:hypothetical protein
VLPIHPAVPSKAVKLSLVELCVTETRMLGAFVITSMGVSDPPARILPVITRLVTFFMASAPPTAATYFSRI